MKSLNNPGLIKSAALIITALSVLYYVASYAPSRLSTQFDDSYMYCRYASNFLSGNGFSWNINDGASFGATSSAYLVLITILKSLFPTGNSFLLSLTSFSAGLAGLFFLVYSGYLYGENISKLHLPLLAVPLCLFSSSFRYHSFTGMETTLAFCSNTILILAVVVYSRKPCNRAMILMLLAAVLSISVRPDNGVYSSLFPVLYLGAIGKLTQKRALFFLFSFALMVGVLLLLYSSLFGSPLPIPFYAKSGGFFTGYAGAANWNAVDYLLTFLKDAAPFAAVVILLGSKEKLPVYLSIAVPMLITFVYFSTTVQIMGWFARYYFPSIPFLVLAAFISTEDCLKSNCSLSSAHLLKRVPFLIVYMLPIVCVPVRSELARWWSDTHGETQLFTPAISCETASGGSLEPIPWWDSIQAVSSIVGELPSGVVVAATEYGYIASENLHAEVVDMAGLHDLKLVQEGFSSGRILSRQPDLIWMPHSDYTFFRKELLEDPAFYMNYDYFAGVFNYGVALRRNSDMYSEMLAALESEFKQSYPGKELNDYLASIVD